MSDSQQFILMIQPNRFQGFVWKVMLKSQQIPVIWESPDTDLMDNLNQLKQAGLNLPSLLLLDICCLGDNPYAFCRWGREHHPEVNILLTKSNQFEVSSPEREWAMHQGAADLLPGIRPDNLVTGATAGIKRLLEILNYQNLNDGALISVLLKLRRELENRQEAAQPPPHSGIPVSSPPMMDQGTQQTTSTPMDNPFVATNLAPGKQGTNPQNSNGTTANGNQPTPPAPVSSRLKLRYRGVSY
jgi:hypothetical protein